MTISKRVENIEDVLNDFMFNQDERDSKLDDIHRALYGDKVNGAEGLLVRYEKYEVWKKTVNEVIKNDVALNSKLRAKVQNSVNISAWTIGGTGAGVGVTAYWDQLLEVIKSIIT